MIDQLRLKLEELEIKKQEVKPKIDDLNAQKEEEIKSVTEKYEKIISEVNGEVNQFEQMVNNEFINSFISVIMDEFDLKRSTSEYSISENIGKYKDYFSTVEIFPKELVDRLESLINGDPIENVAYDIEKIQEKYLIS